PATGRLRGDAGHGDQSRLCKISFIPHLICEAGSVRNPGYLRTPTFVSSSQLSNQFNDNNDAGTWTVYVTNPSGQTSNTWSFTVL
ncbi:MAG: hypothetical protein ACLQKA_05005, partial [Bryobacteraceae bacterium]